MIVGRGAAHQRVAAATGGRLVGPDVTVDGLAIDSRLVTGGELFVPLVAERDGHDFVGAALAAGAAAYLTAARRSTGERAAPRSRWPTRSGPGGAGPPPAALTPAPRPAWWA